MPTRCMPTLLLRCLCLLLMGGLLPIAAQAQEPDTSDQQLPEISPREVEIRGELNVSFPSLKRQPLTGFASPPKIPSVPSGRLPYAAPYKQALEDLPESLPAPEGTSQSVARPEPADDGFLQVGGGRYASRFVEGRYFLDLTANQSFSFHSDYYGTEGFSAFTDPDVRTPSDEFDGSVKFESRHDGFAFQTDVHGQADSYTLYGLAADSDLDAPSRSGISGGLSAALRTFGSIKSRVGIGYDRTAYDTELPPSASSSQNFQEDRFQINGRLRLPIGTREAQFDLSFDRATYGGDVSSSAGYSVNGGGSVSALETDRLTLTAGARIMTYNAPTNLTQPDPGSDSGIYILPEARVEFNPSSNLTLFAENQPTLNSDGLKGLYADNPYAQHAPSVRPTVYTTNAEAGLVTSVGPVRLQPTAGFRYAPSFQAFRTPVTAGTPDNAPMQVGYGSARILRGGGELALQGIEGVEASIDAYVRNGTLVEPDTDIPYFSPVVAHTLLSVSFNDQKGLIKTTGTFESARPINPNSDREADAYVDLDLEGSYRITSLLDGVLAIRNLSPSAPTHWARYPRPPTTISAGFRIHW